MTNWKRINVLMKEGGDKDNGGGVWTEDTVATTGGGSKEK